ncbi:hypothetical protein BGZ76_004203 [Entomortierella beljakovae]|nr:hypothetical protein BGZ76_004203 [Entomortierella beljakovae]
MRESYDSDDSSSSSPPSISPPPPCDNLLTIAIDTLAANSGLQSLELHLADDEDEVLRKSLISTLATHDSISRFKWDFTTCRIVDTLHVKVSEVISLIDRLPDSITDLELVYIKDGFWEPCHCCGLPEPTVTDYSMHTADDMPALIYSPIKIFNLKSLRIAVDNFSFPLDTSVIIPVLKCSPYLEELSLPGWNGDSLESLINVLKKSCPRLQSLDICYGGISDENISQIIRELDDLGLKSLTVGFQGGELKDTISSLADSKKLCSTLTHLHLRKLEKDMEAKDVSWLLEHLTSLKNLSLMSYDVYGGDFYVGISLQKLVPLLENNPRNHLYKLESLGLSMLDDVWKVDNDDQKTNLVKLLVRLHRVLRRFPRLKNLNLTWDRDCFSMTSLEVVSIVRKMKLNRENDMTEKDFMWIGGHYWVNSQSTSGPYTPYQRVQPREEEYVQVDEGCFDSEYIGYKSRNRHHSRSGKKKSAFKRPLNK